MKDTQNNPRKPRVSRTGKREVRERIVQDPEGRGVPVYVLVPLRVGQKLTVRTTTVTTIRIEKDDEPDAQ